MNDQTAPRLRPPAPQLADFPHRVSDTIRFGDLDPQGHVNQAMFLTYFETGRVAMFRKPDLGIGLPDLTYVMVRMQVDYLKELRWPGTVEIGTGVARFGRSSFHARQAIFCNGLCAATGEATLVCMNVKTRQAVPLPAEALESLGRWKLPGA